MIVCVCRGISDRTLRAVIGSGARTRQQIEDACGAGSDCGACRLALTEMIEETCRAGAREPTGPISIRAGVPAGALG